MHCSLTPKQTNLFSFLLIWYWFHIPVNKDYQSRPSDLVSDWVSPFWIKNAAIAAAAAAAAAVLMSSLIETPTLYKAEAPKNPQARY